MKYKLCMIFLGFSFILNAQKSKHLINKYWGGANVNILYGIPKTGVGGNINLGKKLKKGINIGIGYGYNEFNDINKLSIVNLIIEKDFRVGQKSLFFNFKPGVAIPLNGKEQFENFGSNWWWDGYEYEKKKNGLNLQANAGIKWLVGRHNYFLSAGYNITKYSLKGNENIYERDGTVKGKLAHQYNLQYNKVIVSLGFTL
jgi:hypothetical protein